MAPMLNPHSKNSLFFGSVSPLWEITNYAVMYRVYIRFGPTLYIRFGPTL
jgi:hypothetical protein